MIYRSNLDCPDLTPYFHHLVSRPMGHSFGHDVPSDWADYPKDDPVLGLYKQCGLWTHDEAAILFNAVKAAHPGPWADIGAHTGWTSFHIAAGLRSRGDDSETIAVDPMLRLEVFLHRLEQNVPITAEIIPCHRTSADWMTERGRDGSSTRRFAGFCIDGDHEPGKPLEDAKNALPIAKPDAVLIFHDGVGAPVREAVAWLMDKGWCARMYLTPHVVFVCWNPLCWPYVPPQHVPDPEIVWQNLPARMPDFAHYLRRLS